MASGGNTLSKCERLSGKKSIAALLADGRWGAYGHFRYCWMATDPSAKSKGQVRVPQGEPGTCIAFPQGLVQTVTADQPAVPQEGCCPSSQKNAHQGSTPPAQPELASDTGIACSTVPANVQPGRILISVPKRFFKRAVKRNLLKRRIREAYRVQKLAGVDVMFQYASAELADFEVIKADVTAILARIQAAGEAAASASLRDPVRENAPAAAPPAAMTEGCRPSSQKNAHQTCTHPAGTTEL